MRDESEIRRIHDKLARMNKAGYLNEHEQRKLKILEWVLHDE